MDLALIGNGSIGALVDGQARVVWCCLPRFDGDPVFCSLLDGEPRSDQSGTFTIELVGGDRTEQRYLQNTPILVTRIYDAKGGGVEITDFCPRFEVDGEMICPAQIVRQVRPIGGRPVIVVRLNPAGQYGCIERDHAMAPYHLGYSGEQALLLATDAPTESIVDAVPFHLHQTVTLIFGEANVMQLPVTSVASALLERTTAYWQGWSRALKVPDTWRDAVIRAAITLELNVYEETGAIIASITTSIPEAPNTERTWDYRYCWPRDACFVVNSLGRLGETRTTERYLAFLLSVAEAAEDSRLVPMYTIDGGPIPDEHEAECLAGYRGMGPVHVGNKAAEQQQNDVYGEAVLTAEPLFLSTQATWLGDEALFTRLERFGNHAFDLYEVPDAGPWELRGEQRVHTFASIMCWVACDRLARYADRLSLADRAKYWRLRAGEIHEVILRRSWNEDLKALTATMEGDSLDASLLLIPRLGFLTADDPRFTGTVAAIERSLKHGDFVYRYVERDDFGHPENAFLVCTFWYIEALAAMGGHRRDEALALFEKVLSARNRHGLLAEDLDPDTLEQWGNFPQTYCMAGIIDCALSLA
ncbi:MAG: glycoside hydrolase family 15 protein [Gemmatimonadota bacterium]|nr:glycoside hydrolase family 15 protein [Gemmatimonadota bacterium]